MEKVNQNNAFSMILFGFVLFYSDINMLKEANFSMHLYTNKELCEIVFKVMDWQGIYKS